MTQKTIRVASGLCLLALTPAIAITAPYGLDLEGGLTGTYPAASGDGIDSEAPALRDLLFSANWGPGEHALG